MWTQSTLMHQQLYQPFGKPNPSKAMKKTSPLHPIPTTVPLAHSTHLCINNMPAHVNKSLELKPAQDFPFASFLPISESQIRRPMMNIHQMAEETKDDVDTTYTLAPHSIICHNPDNNNNILTTPHQQITVIYCYIHCYGNVWKKIPLLIILKFRSNFLPF